MNLLTGTKTRQGFTLMALFRKKAPQGFTLMELIIVIAIIGILSSMVLTVINPVTQLQKSADAKRKSDLSQISKAIEAYYSDHGSYPSVNANYELVVLISGTSTALAWGSAWPPYIDTLPKDSTSTKKYIYVTPTTGSGALQSFYLYASLDRGTQDSQACTGASGCPNIPSGVKCGTATDICNYGITSPNVSP